MVYAISVMDSSNLLAETRRRLGLSQDAVARHLGVHQTTVMRWERGDTPIRPIYAAAVRRFFDDTAAHQESALRRPARPLSSLAAGDSHGGFGDE